MSAVRVRPARREESAILAAANADALEFYRRLGGAGAEVRIMGVDGERLRVLASAAP